MRDDSDIVIANEDVSSDRMQSMSEADTENMNNNGDSGSGSSSSATLNSSNIVVYICGAVISPGVYELPSGCRVNDAVVAAGGFSDEADRNYINLAATVSDGVKIMIPTRDEVAGSGGYLPETDFGVDSGVAVSEKSSDKGLININTATAEELKSLPGIGDSVSGKILDYRQKNGNFKCIEDIMKVSGIKEKLFSKIKDKITV